MLENLLELDRYLFEIINQGLSNNLFDLIMPVLRNKLTWIPLYLFFIYTLFRQFGKKSIYIILLAFACVACSDLLSSAVIKKTIKRERPCNILPSTDIHVLVRCGTGYSFTSSHATNHFAIALFFTLLWSRKRYAKYLVIWAALISFAQVYVGVHFPFDVLAGCILGLFIGIVFGMIGNHIIKKYIYNLNLS